MTIPTVNFEDVREAIDEYFPKGKTDKRGAAILLHALHIIAFYNALERLKKQPVDIEDDFHRGYNLALKHAREQIEEIKKELT